MKESEVVFAVAHLEPASIDEIIEFWDDDGARSGVQTVVRNVWRDGMLIRRRRGRDGQHGGVPYEYALAAPPKDPDA